MSSNGTIEDLEQYMNIDKNKLEKYISKYGITPTKEKNETKQQSFYL